VDERFVLKKEEERHGFSLFLRISGHDLRRKFLGKFLD